MKNIAFLPTSFEVNRNEASNITTKLLAEKFSKKYNVYIFTGNIRDRKKIENYNKIKIIRFARIYGFTSIWNIYGYLRASLTHICASYLSYINYSKKNKRIPLDVVLGSSASYLLVIRTLLFKLSNKKVKTVHIFKSESSFWKFSFKFLLNRLDLIIVQNDKVRNYLEEIGVSTRVEKINSFIDTNKFAKLTNIRGLEKRYRFENKKIILYYGHFNRFKGVEYLIEAFGYVRDESSVLVLVPSHNSQLNNYDNLIRNHVFKDRIKILKAHTNIVDILNIAEILVLPYPKLISTESNPSCIIESLSCGTPIITSNLKDLKGVFQNNVIYAEPKDAQSIAEKINLLLYDVKLYEKMINKGILFSKKFDINLISEKYFYLIREITNGK